MKAFAIHEIHLGPTKIVQPGTVFDLPKEEFDVFEPRGAVRQPTELELQLAALAAGGKIVEAEEAPEPAAEPAPAKGKGKDAAKDDLV